MTKLHRGEEAKLSPLNIMILISIVHVQVPQSHSETQGSSVTVESPRVCIRENRDANKSNIRLRGAEG